jgi:glyoxylase-like metal-dependent hydrolase (beta-lactamase superfamily II)
MYTVHKIFPVGFAANCYLLTADGKNAVAIDPAQERILDQAEKLDLTIQAVLLTHGHFDHVGACNTLFKRGVPIYCAAAEKELVTSEDSLYLQYDAPMPAFQPQATLKDGQKITLCGIPFTVLSTPGHTAGSVTYRAGDALFTGDTLFRGSVGRTDFPTGNSSQLVASVKKLYALDGDLTVYTGHGEDTSLSFERRYNMFVKCL